MSALQMYIKAGLPAKAARIAISHNEIASQSDVIERIAAQLVKGGLHERVSSSALLIIESLGWTLVETILCFIHVFTQLLVKSYQIKFHI